ncbi:MAG: cyclic nucleotide-binding domain-containing protein [Bdellovibrionales bacterium]|nr:cyclic nucleotide-binding domain-containing protein [Bdellovibrionales bacterium]NQZ18042.1 cyclic nucleotide-binding domain-containing protein [Bdellovibrionales bacterium]
MIQYLWENILKKRSGENDVFTFLKDSFLFKDLSLKEIEFLTQLVHVRHFEAGEKIFKQGDPGVGMYLILNGTIDIIMHDPSSEMKSTKPEEIFITRLEKGDFFGELSLIEEPSYRSASAISLNRSCLIGFFKPDLLQVIQRNPLTGNKISLRLAEILGKRLRETTEKVTELCVELNQLKKDTTGMSSGEKHFTS